MLVDLELVEQAAGGGSAGGASIASGLVSASGIAPPARLSWPPARAEAVDDVAEDLAAVPAELADADRELEQVLEQADRQTAQLTWSKRMKKSASSAMMSGWGTAPHQLTTRSR